MAEELIQPELTADDAAPAVRPAEEPFSGEIVARADRSYRLKRFILVAVIFVYGLMSVRDGFFRYPRENAEDQAKGFSNVRHPGLDIPFNQALGVILPPAALALLAWSLYASRGELRFDGATVRVPGHPPVPLSSIQGIDRTRWDRKGIAVVSYAVPGSGKTSQFKLDDFVYRRPPTDQIFAHLEAALSGATSTPALLPGSEDAL